MRRILVGVLAALALAGLVSGPVYAASGSQPTANAQPVTPATDSAAFPIGGTGFNGVRTAARPCDKVAYLNLTIAAASANIQAIAGVASQSIYVCGYQLNVSTATAATTVQFIEGTGTNCGTGTAPLTPILLSTPTAAPTSPNLVFGPMPWAVPYLRTAGDSLCIQQASTTNATTITGIIFYTQN